MELLRSEDTAITFICGWVCKIEWHTCGKRLNFSSATIKKSGRVFSTAPTSSASSSTSPTISMSGCSEIVATISSRINRGRFATSTRMGFIACSVFTNTPLQSQARNFLDRFACPHDRNVSYCVQNPLLRSFNLARMNVERGPIKHAAILLRRHGDNPQLRMIAQQRVTQLRPFRRLIQRYDQQVRRNLPHCLCYLRLVSNFAHNLDAGLIRQS